MIGKADHFIEIANKMLSACIEMVITRNSKLTDMFNMLVDADAKTILKQFVDFNEKNGSKRVRAAIGTMKQASEKELGSVLTTLSSV